MFEPVTLQPRLFAKIGVRVLRPVCAARHRQSGLMRPGIVAAAALAIIVLAIALLLQRPGIAGPGQPSDADFSTDDQDKIERGRYLAVAGNCASCHTAPGGEFMAGGRAFETPFGIVYSTNVTPDSATGIGEWTGQQFLDSMRHGVRPDGSHLYPVFPYTAFTRMRDDDVAALFAYFKSLPAVNQAAPGNELGFPFSQRSLMAFWKALFFQPGSYRTNDAESEQWNRGAYLVEALAHCSACHSPRNVLGAEKSGDMMGGGVYQDTVPGGAVRDWSAPNLTSAAHALGSWPGNELVAYLETGMNSFVDSHGPMNEVILNSTRYLRRFDIEAMAAYLKSLPAIEAGPRPAADSQVLGMGRTQYNLHCGTCHLPTGLGDAESAPRLASGSLIVQDDNPASLINVILYGPDRPEPPLATERRNPMDAFQYRLTDEEVAALATFVRSSWGNAGGVVTAEQVAKQR